MMVEEVKQSLIVRMMRTWSVGFVLGLERHVGDGAHGVVDGMPW